MSTTIIAAMTLTDYIAPGATVILLTVGVFGGGWLKIIKETNSLLKEQKALLT